MKKTFLLFAALTVVAAAVAQTTYRVEHLDQNINTFGGEMGATVLDDSILLYSSMRTEKKSCIYLNEFTPILSQIFQASIAPDGRCGTGELNTWGLNRGGKDCGSPAFDPESRTIYYTQTDWDGGGTTQIFYSEEQGGRWTTPKLLGGNVNLKGTNNTHPTIGRTSDGKTLLFFASDRPGGLGGFDIWSCVVMGGRKPSNPTNLGPAVNSDSNDITPFFCQGEQTLYFSSDRPGGAGGFDVYAIGYPFGGEQGPTNLGGEINSPHNDLFFYVRPNLGFCAADSLAPNQQVEACGFFASNRDGSLYAQEPNCCNDIYRWSRIATSRAAAAGRVAGTPPLRPQDMLPLCLYFHNDEPNPASADTCTRQRYTPLLRRYLQLRDIYKGSQPSPVDGRKRDSIQRQADLFFDLTLKRTPDLIDSFFCLLYKDLRNRKRVELTIDGYASPLFEPAYNLALSKRRICCFKNELIDWNDNALLPFLNNGSLRIIATGRGAASTAEVASSDPLRNPKSALSVFSLRAAHERRIEVVGYRYF